MGTIHNAFISENETHPFPSVLHEKALPDSVYDRTNLLRTALFLLNISRTVLTNSTSPKALSVHCYLKLFPWSRSTSTLTIKLEIELCAWANTSTPLKQLVDWSVKRNRDKAASPEFEPMTPCSQGKHFTARATRLHHTLHSRRNSSTII